MKTHKILIAEDDVFSKGAVEKSLQDHRCETHIFLLHRGIFLFLILLLLVLFVIQISQAQEALPKLNKPNMRMDSQGARGQSASFVLTEDQKKALENLKHTYMAEVMPIRSELLVLKIELRYFLSDPNIHPRILFKQQREISLLQARLEEVSLSYQVKAKSIFTKEQLERLPKNWAIEIIPGEDMVMGVIGGRQKGRR